MEDIILVIIGMIGAFLIGYAVNRGLPKIFNSPKKGSIIALLRVASVAFEFFGAKLKEDNPKLYKAFKDALDKAIETLNDPTLSDAAKEELLEKMRELFKEALKAIFGRSDITEEEVIELGKKGS